MGSRFLQVYGPRLGVFALVVGGAAALLLLYRRLQAQEVSHVGLQLDGALSMPDAELDRRLETLKRLQQSYPGCDAEPWVLLSLGNQLFRKAQLLPPGAEADALSLEAYQCFLAVSEKHPAHAAAPLALLSAGSAAEEAGRVTEAKRLYAELQERYPMTYLVAGGSGNGSLQSFHAEGLLERVGRLRKVFP